MNTPPRNSRQGLTLIEVVVSLILVSTVLLVSITASANLFRDQSSANTTMLAYELIGEILDEISVRSFRDTDDNVIFGIEPDEDVTTRATFDDIDDYNGYVDSPPTYRDGPAIDGYTGWSFQVTVARANTTGTSINITTEDDAPLRLITIVCTAPNGLTRSESIVVSEITSNLDNTTTFDRMRRINLGFSAERNINISAPLRNQPTPTSN